MGRRPEVNFILRVLAAATLCTFYGLGCGGSNSNVSGQGGTSDTIVSLQARISSGVSKGTVSCAETCEYTYTAGTNQTTKSHQVFSSLAFRCDANGTPETEQGFEATFTIDPNDQEVLEGGTIEVTCCPAGGSLVDEATFNLLTINCFNDTVDFNAQACLRDPAKCLISSKPTSLGEQVSNSGITGLLSTLKCPTLNFLYSFCQSDTTPATDSPGFTCGTLLFFLQAAQCPAVVPNKCGNGTFDPGELCDPKSDIATNGGCPDGSTCNSDCTRCTGQTSTCGNGTCDSCEQFQVDGVQFCSFDCGPPGGTCGDGTCGQGETNDNCQADCHTEIFIHCFGNSVLCTEVNCDCKSAIGPDSVCENGCCTAPPPPPDPYCGDGSCNGRETIQSCAFDCGGDTSGPHACGNGLSEGPEICDIGSFASSACQGGVRLGSLLRCSFNHDCVACEAVSSDAFCDNDGFCEEFEDNISCPHDCQCGNGRCDLVYEHGAPCPPGTECGWVSCPQDCPCGNSVVEGTEECDDGNPFGRDGCNRLCQFECGDGQVDEGEQCDFVAETSDPGNPVCRNTFGPGWTCSTSCYCEPGEAAYCGNGIIDAPGEICDRTAGCSGSERCNHFCDRCEFNLCDGDGFAEAGEQCDVDGGGNTFTPSCLPGQTCSRCQCVTPR